MCDASRAGMGDAAGCFDADDLRRSCAEWQAAFNAINAPVCVMDLAGRIQIYNKAWCDFVGKPAHEIANRPCWELVHGTSEPVDDCPFVRMRESGRSEMSQLPVGNRWFEVTAHPIFQPDGSISACVHTMTEITARRQAEVAEGELRRQLERVKRQEALEGLAGGVAHDLNNCLNPLVGLPELIAENLQEILPPRIECDEILDQLDELGKSARRAASVVRNLVTVTGARSSDRRPMDLSVAVRACLELPEVKDLRAEHTDIAVTLEISRGAVVISGSEGQLLRALENLVRNAYDAVQSDGSLHVSVARSVLSRALVGYETVPPGEYAVVRIKDSGPGMSPAMMERAFEPFFTGKSRSEHSGLGLAIVHSVVRGHGGYIDVQSTLGEGMMIALYLPLCATELESSPKRVAAEVDGKRILVIDDEPLQRRLACSLLEDLEFRVETAGSGEEAVAMFRRVADRKEPSPFDLVLLDMIMNGIDGVATYREIAALYPDQRVMVVSGHAPSRRAEELALLGCSYLTKPYTKATLHEAVVSALSGTRPGV